MKFLNVVLTTAFLSILGQGALAATQIINGSFEYENNIHTIEQIQFTVEVDGLVSIESSSDELSYLYLFDGVALLEDDYSSIETELAAGDYMVTIGLLGYQASDALAGFDALAPSGLTGSWTVTINTPMAVPVPAALPLFFSALTGLALVRRRKAA